MLCPERCVDEGLVPSRPLRSPVATPPIVPFCSRLWGLFLPTTNWRQVGSACFPTTPEEDCMRTYLAWGLATAIGGTLLYRKMMRSGRARQWEQHTSESEEHYRSAGTRILILGDGFGG